MELNKYLVVESRRGWKKYVHLYDSPEDCSGMPLEIGEGIYTNTGSAEDPDFSGLYFRNPDGKVHAILRHGAHRNVYDKLFHNEVVDESSSRYIALKNDEGMCYNKTFKGCTINTSAIKALSFKSAISANELFANATIIKDDDQDLSLYFENLRPNNCQNMFRNTKLSEGLVIHLHGVSPRMYNLLGISDTNAYILEGLANWKDLALQLNKEIKVIDEPFLQTFGAWPADMGNALDGMENLKHIATEYMDGYYVTNTAYAFRNCRELQHIDVKFLKGEPLQNLTGMFSGCSSLRSISHLNEVTITKDAEVWGLFQDCKELKYIFGIGSWDVSGVASLANLFRGCAALSGANIQNWKTSRIVDASGMFQGCEKWGKPLKMAAPFLENAVNINHLFAGVSPTLVQFAHDLGVGKENAMSAAEDLDYLFEFTAAPKGIDISTWTLNTDKQVHCKGAFNSVDTPMITLWSNSETAANCDYTGAFTHSTVKYINGIIPLNSTTGAVFTNCPDVRSVLFSGDTTAVLACKGTLKEEQYLNTQESYQGARVIRAITSYDDELGTYVTKYTIRSFSENVGTHFLHIQLPDGGLVSCFSFRNRKLVTDDTNFIYNLAVTNERAGEVELILKEGATFKLAVTTDELAVNSVGVGAEKQEFWPTIEWSDTKKV